MAKRPTNILKNSWAQDITIKSDTIGNEIFFNVSVQGKGFVQSEKNKSQQLLGEIADMIEGYCYGSNQNSALHPTPTNQANYNMPPNANRLNKPLYKRVWVWLIVVFIGVPLLSAILGSGGVSQAEYDRIKSERDAAIGARDIAIEERDVAMSELNSVKSEMRTLKSKENKLSELNESLQDRVDGLELICKENGLIVDEKEIQRIEDAEASKSAFEKFQEKAQSVTYDDLRRNPDSYKLTPIRITVYVKDEDVDKMFGILQGGYLCTMNGEESAVYDNRVAKEPRLRTGDTATIYGYGGGLAKMQRKEQGLIRNKVVDEWYIPEVRIEYVSIH